MPEGVGDPSSLCRGWLAACARPKFFADLGGASAVELEEPPACEFLDGGDNQEANLSPGLSVVTEIKKRNRT